MAARPVPHSLAALSLALSLAGAAPALAQNYIGTGNVQVNMQALDQLGGVGTASPPALQLPLIGATGKAPKLQLAPQAVQPTGPQPLLGETGQAASAVKLRRPGSATATRKAAASAPATAKAAAAAPPAPAAQPIPAPVQPAPAPLATAPAPTSAPAPAQQAGVPTQVVPAAPAPAVAPAPTPAPTPAPSVAVAAPPAPAAPTPTPVPAPAPAPQLAAPAPASPAPQASPPAARPAPAPQVAAAPVAPRPVTGPGGLVTLAFPGGQGDLPAGDLAALDALAAQYANSEDRLQIRAYAASTVSDGGSGARRLSLTRALAVRQYLIDKGIRSTRIDVRALGAPTDGSAADRVEIAPVGR